MKKYLIALILFIFCFGFIQHQHLAVIGKKNATVCTIDYVHESGTDWVQTNNGADRYYDGIKYTPDSNECICEVDFYAEYLDGSRTNYDYYLRIYALNGSNEITSPTGALGQSSKMDGDSLVVDTWISANAGRFVFSSCVSLTSGSNYGFAIFLDTDGDPDDNPPELGDTDNQWGLGYDDEAATDSIQGGRFSWDSDGTVSVTDAEDDFRIRVFRMQ